jgi:hypothetical protein
MYGSFSLTLKSPPARKSDGTVKRIFWLSDSLSVKNDEPVCRFAVTRLSGFFALRSFTV